MNVVQYVYNSTIIVTVPESVRESSAAYLTTHIVRNSCHIVHIILEFVTVALQLARLGNFFCTYIFAMMPFNPIYF